MNKRIEKWLMVCSLSSWVASIGALVEIEVCSSQPLQVASSSEQPSQTDSVLNGIPDQSSQTLLGLSSHSSHWLDHDLPNRENLDLQFSDLQIKTVQPGTSVSAKETR
ncbi:hypothetical protein [Phormidesmis priestleyi]